MTSLLAGSSCFVAIMFQQVNGYFGLLGGTAGVLMAGGIPALCFYKLAPNRTPADSLILVFCLCMTLAGLTGAFLSLLE